MSMQDQQEPEAMDGVDGVGNAPDDVAKALQVSMQAQPTAGVPETPLPSQPMPAAGSMQDMNFVNSMLASLPGVDPSDPLIQQALQQIQNPGDGKEEGGNEKNGEMK